MYNKNIRELMRDNAYNLVGNLLLEKQEFRLIIWNFNDWSEALPETVMESFPTQLVLDFKGSTLEYSFIDEENFINISTSFTGDSEFLKVLLPEDIIGILDMDGNPLQLNQFVPEEEIDPERFFEDIKLNTKDEIIDAVSACGVNKETAKKSVEALLKNNPQFKINYK